MNGLMKGVEKANGILAEVISRNMEQALSRVAKVADDDWDEKNLEAMVAFEAMRFAQIERHNLRSMQAWLAVKVEKEKLYLAYPPTQEYPEGFGSLREWLRAVGITGSTVHALARLAEVAPFIEENGYEIEKYLNSDRFPKLAEALTRIRALANGEECPFTLDEIMDDVSKAQSRDDMRLKYRQQMYLSNGSVNNLGDKKVLTIITEEERVGTILSALKSKVDWHKLSSTVEERDHEIVLRIVE